MATRSRATLAWSARFCICLSRVTTSPRSAARLATPVNHRCSRDQTSGPIDDEGGGRKLNLSFSFVDAPGLIVLDAVTVSVPGRIDSGNARIRARFGGLFVWCDSQLQNQ